MLKDLSYVGPDWQQAHEQFAKQGKVDLDAPVQGRGEIVIETTPVVAWSTLSDVLQWPSIRCDVCDVSTSGPAAPDVLFTWSTANIQLTSRFGIVEPGRTLTWTTSAPGLTMTHLYVFEPAGTRGTLLKCSESMASPFYAPHIGDGELTARIRSWLEGIKSLAESNA